MEALASARAGLRQDGGTGVIEAVQLDYVVTPFRAQRFVDRYRPAIARPRTYGATECLFFRSEEDPDHFIHLVFWEDRSGFDRWWLSREMTAIRTAIVGLHDQPVLPHWHTVIERG